jgi:hypothetical protein
MATSTAPPRAALLDVSILSRDGAPVSDSDLRRLFSGGSLTAARLDRLRDWPRILVGCGDRLVGAATCQRLEADLVVPDIGICTDCLCPEHDVLNTLLDALEAACLAGGGRRLVLSPPRTALFLLQRRGYEAVSASCAGCWVEKRIG